jgi:hypothetical protein
VEREKRQLRAEERGLQLRRELREVVREGGDFAAKAEELGFTVMTPDPFRVSEPPQGTPFLSQVIQETTTVPAGDLSEPIQTPGGIMLAYVEKREAAPEEQWVESRNMFRQGQAGQLMRQMTSQWFDAALADADFQSNYQ